MAKTVLITGASRGIGKSIAERFKKSGYTVVAPTRTELDLASADSIQKFVDRNAGLAVDVLINNAGENFPKPLESIKLEDWEHTMRVNLTAGFMLIRAFAPGMAKRRFGRIVNISSCYSLFSRAGRAAYTTSKAGLNGLTMTAAIEYGESNILVNSICPGFVETDLTRQNNNEEQLKSLMALTAVKRLAQPEEIAEFAFFLGSESNTFITGQSILIDGGFSIQ